LERKALREANRSLRGTVRGLEAKVKRLEEELKTAQHWAEAIFIARARTLLPKLTTRLRAVLEANEALATVHVEAVERLTNEELERWKAEQ
jgi:hypothetical protein